MKLAPYLTQGPRVEVVRVIIYPVRKLVPRGNIYIRRLNVVSTENTNYYVYRV